MENLVPAWIFRAQFVRKEDEKFSLSGALQELSKETYSAFIHQYFLRSDFRSG